MDLMIRFLDSDFTGQWYSLKIRKSADTPKRIHCDKKKHKISRSQFFFGSPMISDHIGKIAQRGRINTL